MKITKDELAGTTEASPLELFRQGIRAEETLCKYTNTLKRMLCDVLEDILEGTFEQRAAQLVREGKANPEKVRDILLLISKKQRERTCLPRDDPDYFNPSSMRNYFKPIKKLLDMNDVNLSWKRIYATFPEIDNVAESHGWTKEEIRTMLRFCDGPIERAIILIAASSGMRLGGFDLKWDHIRPVYRVGGRPGRLSLGGTGNGHGTGTGNGNGNDTELVCATISVYSGTSSAYPAFITPEAYAALQDYAQLWEQEVGRAPEPDDPVFKRVGGAAAGAVTSALKRRIDRIAKKAGLRDATRKKERRFDVPIMNGFRRFWNKACKEAASRDSPLASLIKKEYIMGHVGLVSLDRNYFKTRTLELAEEYLQVIPALTMDESEELRQVNCAQDEMMRRLRDEKDARILHLEELVKEMMRRYKMEREPGIKRVELDQAGLPDPALR